MITLWDEDTQETEVDPEDPCDYCGEKSVRMIEDLSVCAYHVERAKEEVWKRRHV